MDATYGRAIKTSDATVVMATYDIKRWPLLEGTVESILGDKDQPGCVVIAVDQNRELYAKVRETWPQITTVLNSDRRGASTTRNTGVGPVRTPFIAFVDDDIRVYRGWLSRLLEPFADPTIVGTGGGVVAGWETGRPELVSRRVRLGGGRLVSRDACRPERDPKRVVGEYGGARRCFQGASAVFVRISGRLVITATGGY